MQTLCRLSTQSYTLFLGKRDIEQLCLGCGDLKVAAPHPLFEGGLCKECKEVFKLVDDPNAEFGVLTFFEEPFDLDDIDSQGTFLPRGVMYEDMDN